MIIIDKKLQELENSGKSIGVALIGAGFMARGIATQIHNYTPGMRLIGVANRTVDRAQTMIAEIGAASANLQITDDPIALINRADVDVVVEVTGAMEYGAMVILEAFKAKKHVVSMNAEVDATIGHILRDRAREAGVVYTVSDGDQPGVQLNLYRYVQGLGLKPVLCGNVKGLQDPYRNPTTQEAFAKKWGQNPYMVTSFADGTKISFEQACVANAVGMRVAKRGMHGPTVPPGTPIEKSVDLFPLDDLVNGPGIVDYVVGPVPNGGIFVLATHDDPIQKHYLNLYKVGEGPLYCFYAPYHLCHFETPSSIARAYFFRDETLVAQGDKPMVEVVTVAKTDLKQGDTLDAFGGYSMYGVCENSPVARAQNLLPIGLAEGATLKREVKKDACLTFDDVELAPNSLVQQLWSKQHGV
jgi:predicted homoserine dehydrogenase-like protein